MLLVASSNGIVGFPAAIEVLARGGSALDAVEAAVRVVEDDLDDHTVGSGGYPNLRGVVELDACIIDGRTRASGAVGALQGFPNPISVARAVMERLPHVLLAGEGAAEFAAEAGFERRELLTPEAERVWRDGVEGRLGGDSTGARMLALVNKLTADPEAVGDAGTVNVLAIDGRGHLASAVSTSGWAFKHPGRLGDSPIVGAGSSCDDRWGAAGCTGFGELAIRASSAHTVLAALQAGVPVADACTAALADVFDLGVEPSMIVMNIVAIDRDGGHHGVSTEPGRTYAVWDGDGEPRLVDRAVVRQP